MPILETQDLTYVYGAGTPFEKTAVDHISLQIEEGELVGVIGHTGSGKSTFVQQLNGLLKPTSGKVLLKGKDIWAEPKKIRAIRFQVGMVFQYPEHQLFEETVEKDIAFGPKNMGLSEEEIKRRVKMAAAFAGLKDNLLGASPFEISGGEKRRYQRRTVWQRDPEQKGGNHRLRSDRFHDSEAFPGIRCGSLCLCQTRKRRSEGSRNCIQTAG